jgi:hypothetical protein
MALKGKLEERGAVGDDIENNWEYMKHGILEAAKSTLEFRISPKRNEWYDEECEEAITMRNQAHNNYIRRPTKNKELEYDKKRRIADKICRKKNGEALNEQMIKINEQFKTLNIHMAFKDIKSQREGFKPKTDMCKDRDGKIVAHKEGMKERWVEYFQELLNVSTEEVDCLTRVKLILVGSLPTNAGRSEGFIEGTKE